MNTSSHVVAEDPTTNLAIVCAMSEELEDYIVDDDLYRTITVRVAGGNQDLQMTGADLLTRLYRLHGERNQLSSSQQTQLDEVQQQVRQTIYSLRTRFHHRLMREIKARLDSLKWFLDDCGTERERCRIEFPFEMRNRQRIEEALKELDYQLSDQLQKQLHQIDGRIRQIAVASPFLWDERLRPIFPAETYWYLYMCPTNLS